MNWVLLVFGSYMWLSEIRVLSHKTICPDFFEPQTLSQPPVEEIWEHRSSTEISTQNLISWVFCIMFEFIGLYMICYCLDLWVFFFPSHLCFSFTLFVDLIYSYFINQFRVNKLIWFPYSFLSFNKNFGLFSIFACQLFDLRPSLIDIQKQWYC